MGTFALVLVVLVVLAGFWALLKRDWIPLAVVVGLAVVLYLSGLLA